MEGFGVTSTIGPISSAQLSKAGFPVVGDDHIIKLVDERFQEGLNVPFGFRLAGPIFRPAAELVSFVLVGDVVTVYIRVIPLCRQHSENLYRPMK